LSLAASLCMLAKRDEMLTTEAVIDATTEDLMTEDLMTDADAMTEGADLPVAEETKEGIPEGTIEGMIEETTEGTIEETIIEEDLDQMKEEGIKYEQYS
jgi:hypothetical protein